MALHSMGRRQGGSSMAVDDGSRGGGSSIVLLQERFRQLQRMKEKRREMELLKLFPGPETMGQVNHFDPPERSLVHPEMKKRPSFQDSLSLGLELYTKKAEPQKPMKTSSFLDFWSVDSMSCAHDKPEVDTSLHL